MTIFHGKMNLDKTDRGLMNLLRENARLSVSELARELKIARTTVQSRIERLERANVITGYTLKPTDLGGVSTTKAHVMITVLPKALAAVVTALRRISEIHTLHSVSGTFDLIAMVTTPTTSQMDKVIDSIGLLEGVERTTTSVIMSTRISR